MTSRATNPTSSGSMLLDRSTAKPGSIDKAIFEKKSGSDSNGQVGQGTVNPNYLEECRRDNPEPATAPTSGGPSSKATLSGCKITTPQDQLGTDRSFKVSCDVSDLAASAGATLNFQLFCSVVKPDGKTDPPQGINSKIEGKAKPGTPKQTVTAEGTLFSPVPAVPRGTKLRYHVVATHPDAAAPVESPKVDVIKGTLPKPVTNWALNPIHFDFDSSAILPSAATDMPFLKKMVDDNPNTLMAVFGHADPVGDDEPNKKLSARRARMLFALITRDTDIWIDLSKKVGGDDWGIKANQMMLSRVKSKKTGQPYYPGSVDGKSSPEFIKATKAFQVEHGLNDDGVIGPKTKAQLYPSYMDAICVDDKGKPYSFPANRFMGDGKSRGAYQGCGELNPVVLISEADNKKYKAQIDKTERNFRNAPNRRTVVALFKKGDFSDSDPAKAQWPCPAWSAPCKECMKEQWSDGNTRRSARAVERVYPSDKQTMSCMFYTDVGEKNIERTVLKPKIDIFTEDGSRPAPIAMPKGGSIRWKATPKDGALGKFKWSASGSKVKLENPDSATVTIKSIGGISDTGSFEEITLEFTPSGAQSPLVSKYPLHIVRVVFSQSTGQSFGFDNGDIVDATWNNSDKLFVPALDSSTHRIKRKSTNSPDRISVGWGLTTEVLVRIEGGSPPLTAFAVESTNSAIVTGSLKAAGVGLYVMSIKAGAAPRKFAMTDLLVVVAKSGTSCGSIHVQGYKFTTKNAQLIFLENGEAGSKFGSLSYDRGVIKKEINNSYQQAAVKLDLKTNPKIETTTLAIWNKEADAFVYDYGQATKGCRGEALKYCNSVRKDKSLVCVVVVKKMITPFFLDTKAPAGSNLLKFRSDYKGAPSRFFQVGGLFDVGNLSNSVTEKVIVVKPPAGITPGSNEVYVSRAAKGADGRWRAVPGGLLHEHPTGHAMFFPAGAWSGSKDYPVIVSASSYGSSRAMADVIGHELGHTLLKLLDVVDDSVLMHYTRGYDHGLRHTQAPLRYTKTPAYESQWTKCDRS